MLCSCLVVAAAITAVIFIYRGNNYSGTDIDKYAGKWEMTELWQNGEQVGIGFGDTVLEIKTDGTVKYKDSNESYDVKLQTKEDRLTLINDEGYQYTLSIKSGYLTVDAVNTKDENDPGGQFI